MSEDKTARVPKYRIIENDIIDKINTGVYSANQSIPTEAQLSKVYSCSRVTIRQVLSNLAYKGFITKAQGCRTIVNIEKSISRSPLLMSFSEDMKSKGKIPSTKVVAFNITEAGRTVSSLLKIKPADRVYYIERLRFADSVPILFEKTFMSVDLHPDISVKILEGSKYEYADKHGFIIDYAYQTITPIFPPDYIAVELNIPTSQPILRVSNPTIMVNGDVFDYTELYMNSELYQLNIIKKR